MKTTRLSKKSLTDALNELGGKTGAQIVVIATSSNAPLARRLAAVLCVVSVSQLSITDAVADLIMDLQEPNPKPIPDFVEGIRNNITRLLKTPKSQIKKPDDMPIGERMALQLIILANSRTAVPNTALSSMLRRMTGKDAYWWLDWIRTKQT